MIKAPFGLVTKLGYRFLMAVVSKMVQILDSRPMKNDLGQI